MRKPKPKPVNWSEIRYFESEAVRWQKASNCKCPEQRRINGVIARKYLIYIIDECKGQKPLG